jgi:hypothetical protein
LEIPEKYTFYNIRGYMPSIHVDTRITLIIKDIKTAVRKFKMNYPDATKHRASRTEFDPGSWREIP